MRENLGCDEDSADVNMQHNVRSYYFHWNPVRCDAARF